MSGRTNSQAQADAFAAWHEQEGIRVSRELLLQNSGTELAEGMLPVIGRLYRRNNVVVTLCQAICSSQYAVSLAGKSPIEIILQHSAQGISLNATVPILSALAELNPGPMRVELADLLALVAKSEGSPLTDVLSAALEKMPEPGPMANPMVKARDIVLYGFGRIGRLVARLLIAKTGSGEKLLLRAIVVRRAKVPDLLKRASLLIRDSVHGPFRAQVEVDEERNAIIANGSLIHLIYAEDGPASVDYTAYGINDAVVIDNTGIWRDRKGLGQHLQAKGVGKVLLTAPGKGDIPNVVAGINDVLINEGLAQDQHIFSAASCTTNAVVPVLKLMSDQYGIEAVHIESIHSFTNDQNLIDNFHAKERRGRAAPLNLVLTETGASAAVAKCLPDLAGKITGHAIRVPTPNVSMAILSLSLDREVTADEVNSFLKASTNGPLRHQVGISESGESASSDFVGSTYASVVDLLSTIVSGKRCTLYCWYDNENGYSCQVVRVVQRLCGIEHPLFPAPEATA